MSLKFNDRAHRYWLDGRPIPGVTTLIGKGLPKPAIPYWAAKMVAEHVASDPAAVAEMVDRMGPRAATAALKEVPWQKRDDAAVRGTDVHALAERLVHGEDVDVPAHLTGHVEGYARWLDRFAVEPIVTEVPVANRAAWYAGKPDAIVRMAGADTVWLLDWKTSSGVYGETALQTAAYARAEFYVTDSPDVEHPMPTIERTGVVHITADGTTLYPLARTPEEIDQAYGIFRHVAWVAGKTDWIKTAVGNPIEEPSHV